jgi:hypothetical protein
MIHAGKLPVTPASAHPLRAHPVRGGSAHHHPAAMPADPPVAAATWAARGAGTGPGAAGTRDIGLLRMQWRGGGEAERDGGDGEHAAEHGASSLGSLDTRLQKIRRSGGALR